MYIYTSIIQPKIDYAISIWGYTTAHNINNVQRLQNRAARILTGNFDYVNTRGIDLVKTLGLMNVTQRRDYFMIIMMFKSIHGLVPDYICDEITMQRDITVRTTRSTVNTLSAKDGDLRLSASNACLPKTEISVFVTECVFFTSTCYRLHMLTLHDVLYS